MTVEQKTVIYFHEKYLMEFAELVAPMILIDY